MTKRPASDEVEAIANAMTQLAADLLDWQLYKRATTASQAAAMLRSLSVDATRAQVNVAELLEHCSEAWCPMRDGGELAGALEAERAQPQAEPYIQGADFPELPEGEPDVPKTGTDVPGMGTTDLYHEPGLGLNKGDY